MEVHGTCNSVALDKPIEFKLKVVCSNGRDRDASPIEVGSRCSKVTQHLPCSVVIVERVVCHGRGMTSRSPATAPMFRGLPETCNSVVLERPEVGGLMTQA